MTNKVLLLVRCREKNLPVVACGGAGGRRELTSVRVGDLSKASHDRLLAEVRRRLRKEHRFPAGHSAMDMPCVYSVERTVFPQPDGSVCEMRTAAEDGARLNCNGGLGSATFVTGAFGFAAAGFVVRKIAEGVELTNPPKHALEIFFNARGERFHFFTEKFRQAGINRREIRRMIQRLAVRRRRADAEFFPPAKAGRARRFQSANDPAERV